MENERNHAQSTAKAINIGHGGFITFKTMLMLYALLAVIWISINLIYYDLSMGDYSVIRSLFDLSSTTWLEDVTRPLPAHRP